ncbi:MAG TPA: hypothetical protein VF062_28840 [Candidatus Limnocylindrales bacterium]
MMWLDALDPRTRSAVVSGFWGRLPHSEHFAQPPTDPDEIDVIADAVAQASDILTELTAGAVHPALQVVEDYVCYPTVSRLTPSLQPLRRIVGLYVAGPGGLSTHLAGAVEHGGNVRFVDADAVAPEGYAWATLDALVYLQLQCRCPDLQRLRLAYDVGSTITASARQAVVSLAHELYLRVSPCDDCGSCRLPLRTTSVTREGISYDVGDPLSIDQPGGTTGLPDVDIWLRSVNPRRSRQASAVYTPDAPPPVVRSLVGAREVFPPLLMSSVAATATMSATGVVA